MTSEVLLDAVSDITEHGHPYYGNCKMIIGDGSESVEFRHGRAKVPQRLARVLARNPHITVFGPTDRASLPTVAPASDAELMLDDRDIEVTTGTDTNPDDALALAREHLAAEGVEVPEPIEEMTSDGMERCRARKADGDQCANKATESGACGLPGHREQLGVQAGAEA